MDLSVGRADHGQKLFDVDDQASRIRNRPLHRIPSSPHEMQDRRDHRKDEQQMNQKARNVKNYKSGDPRNQEHYAKKKKHRVLFPSGTDRKPLHT